MLLMSLIIGSYLLGNLLTASLLVKKSTLKVAAILEPVMLAGSMERKRLSQLL